MICISLYNVTLNVNSVTVYGYRKFCCSIKERGRLSQCVPSTLKGLHVTRLYL